MENFFIRSVEHTPANDFLWSEGHVVKDMCIFKDGAKLLSLSFKPTRFQVLEHNFLLFDHKRLFTIDKHGCEEFVGSLETEPVMTAFNIEESLLVIVLADKCLLLNTYFELINTLPLSVEVQGIEWNPHAHLIYCSTKDSVLVLNTKLELMRSLDCAGPVALRSPNVLAVAHGDKVRFIERNGLEFGDPLAILRDEDMRGTCSHIHFLDRNTLIAISNHISLYFFKNNMWYEKIRHPLTGKFCGIVKNTVYIDDGGLLMLRIFKEFTKSNDVFFVINGNSLLLYDYRVSITPPPLCNKVVKFSGSVVDVSCFLGKLCVLTQQWNSETCFDDAILGVYEFECLEKMHDISTSFTNERIIEVLLLADSVLARTPSTIYSIEVSNSRVRCQIEPQNTVKMYVFGEVLLLDLSGNLTRMCEHLQDRGTLGIGRHTRVSEDDVMHYDVSCHDGTYFRQINSQLFFEGFFVDKIVSFIVHCGFLILTRHTSLSFVKVGDLVLRGEVGNVTTLQELNIPEDLVMEKNSMILTYARSLILYIPRGNIESFELRPIIAESIKENVSRRKYREAMDLSIRNCLSFDLWLNFDIRLDELAQVSRSNLIAFFVEIFRLLKLQEYDAEVVIDSLRIRGLVGQIGGLKLAEQGADALVCPSPTNVFLSLDTSPVELLIELRRILHCDVLVEVLVKLKMFHIALSISGDLGDFVKLAANHTTPNDLIRKSLFVYDLELSSRIASMLDKKSYVEEFKAMKGDNEKFRILDYLKLQRKALDVLVDNYTSKVASHRDCNAPHNKDSFKTVLEYVERHNLYEHALSYDIGEFVELYAKRSFDLKNYEKSLFLYKKVDLAKALEVSFYLEGKRSIEVAEELGIADAGFYKKLVASLVDRGRFEEAAYIKRDLLGENALNYFLRASKPAESLAELKRHLGTCTVSTAADPLYNEFVTRMREMETAERERLAKKALQIDKYIERMRCLEERPCDFSATTFSYSVSGSNVKVNEEEFVHKRLVDLEKEVLASKSVEIASAIRSVGLESDLDSDYTKIVEKFANRAGDC